MTRSITERDLVVVCGSDSSGDPDLDTARPR